MAYIRNTHVDEVKDQHGNIIQVGTPVNANILNNIEDGIVAAQVQGKVEVSVMLADPLAEPTQGLTADIPTVEFASDFLQAAIFSFVGSTGDISANIGYFLGQADVGDMRINFSYSINGATFVDALHTITPGAGAEYRTLALANAIPSAAYVTGDNIAIKLIRLGDDVLDTHTGSLQVASLVLEF